MQKLHYRPIKRILRVCYLFSMKSLLKPRDSMNKKSNLYIVTVIRDFYVGLFMNLCEAWHYLPIKCRSVFKKATMLYKKW